MQIAGPEDVFAIFYTERIEEVIAGLLQARRLAAERGLQDIELGALKIADGLVADINRVADDMALLTDGLIIRKISETQSRNRPFTGEMETHIVSVAGPLGSVFVGLMNELNKIINPRGYGPFWRAQEYGTGSQEVKTQVGRSILGVFQPSGDPPDAAQRGLGVGRDGSFESSAGEVVPNAGKGVIGVDLPGRHFLRDGAAEGAARWKGAMEVVENRWVDRVTELLTRLHAEMAGRNATTTFILDA